MTLLPRKTRAQAGIEVAGPHHPGEDVVDETTVGRIYAKRIPRGNEMGVGLANQPGTAIEHWHCRHPR